MSAMGSIARMIHEYLQLLNPYLTQVFIDLEPVLALDHDTGHLRAVPDPTIADKHLAPSTIFGRSS